MGGLCPSGMTASASVEVAADSDTLWSIVSNMKKSCTACPDVKDFAYLERGDKNNITESSGVDVVGTQARVVRVYNGREFVVRYQITKISDKESPRSISFHSIFDKAPPASMDDFSITSTLSVVPLSDRTTELVGTCAFESPSSACCWRLVFFWWKNFYDPATKKFIVDLKSFGAAAEKKMAKKGDTLTGVAVDRS